MFVFRNASKYNKYFFSIKQTEPVLSKKKPTGIYLKEEFPLVMFDHVIPSLNSNDSLLIVALPFSFTLFPLSSQSKQYSRLPYHFRYSPPFIQLNHFSLLSPTSYHNLMNLALSPSVEPCFGTAIFPIRFSSVNTSSIFSLTQYATGLPGIFVKLSCTAV